MSESFYKDQLYPLQDVVLSAIGTSGSRLYLTGGTFLSRFLLHHWFSDDLDFFLNQDKEFHKEVDKIIAFSKTCGEVEVSFRDDAFVRIFLMKNSVRLKIEFVDDVGYRVGDPVRHARGFLMDTWENVLANKLTALTRVAGKDYADVLFLSLTHKFNWEEMINHSKQKDAWIAEHEIANFLLNFDLAKIKEVIFPEEFNPDKITREHFTILARDAFNGFDNSLYGKTL